MFNMFKSSADRNYDNIVAIAQEVSVYSGLLMTVARNPGIVNDKKFLKRFKQAQSAWFAVFAENATATDSLKLDLTNHNDQLVCSAIAVITASLLEGTYSIDEDMLNIIKTEANLRNVPRVYADAFANYYSR